MEKLAKGQISIDEAEKAINFFAIEEVANLARIDINREVRSGVPEIILAEGKTAKDLTEISLKVLNEKGRVVISRAKKEQINMIRRKLPKDVLIDVNEGTGLILIKRKDFKNEKTGGKVGILAAGTSDIPVAEEARIIAEEMGCEVLAAYDVGVAGLHRLFPPLKKMIDRDVDVIIVVAGREGALPSVVAGLVEVPVIAVPTSIGYGFGEKGVSALMAMLQACSLGITVVNIDGGIPAGAAAALIANRAAKFRNRLKNIKKLKTSRFPY